MSDNWQENATLDDAFEWFPEGTHNSVYYDHISGEWYVEIDQSPLRKLSHYDKTGKKSLAIIIIEACKLWRGRSIE